MFTLKKRKGQIVKQPDYSDYQGANRYPYSVMPGYYGYANYPVNYSSLPPLASHSYAHLQNAEKLTTGSNSASFDSQREYDDHSRSLNYKEESDMKYESNESTYNSNTEKYSFSKIGNERYISIHNRLSL